MSFESRISLRQAERITGIGRHTLRLWLEQDLGLVFPRVPRGSKVLVLLRDLDEVLCKRTPHHDSAGGSTHSTAA